MSRKWSREIVVEHILLRKKEGKPLNSNHIQTNHVPLYLAACNYFGSWKAGIEAAGLSYDDVRVTKVACPVWGKDKIAAVIQRRYKLKQPLNSNHIQTKEPRLYASAVKYFGGWSQAIKAAGLDYSLLRKRPPTRAWTKEALVTAVIERAAKGLSIGGGDVCVADRGLYNAANRLLGRHSWAKARVLAGFDPIDPRPWKVWDTAKVRAEVRRLHEHGVPLNTSAIVANGHTKLLAAGIKVFGSWARAIRAAGLDYSKIRKSRMNWWTRPRILMCIRLLERRGIRLSHRDIQKSHCALLGSAVARFGSWSQAVEAAGISYQRHCRVWSTKAWLRRMDSEKFASLIETAQRHSKRRKNR